MENEGRMKVYRPDKILNLDIRETITTCSMKMRSINDTPYVTNYDYPVCNKLRLPRMYQTTTIPYVTNYDYPVCYNRNYRIYSNYRRGAYLIFRVSGAALIRGRRLFGDGAYSRAALI